MGKHNHIMPNMTMVIVFTAKKHHLYQQILEHKDTANVQMTIHKSDTITRYILTAYVKQEIMYFNKTTDVYTNLRLQPTCHKFLVTRS